MSKCAIPDTIVTTRSITTAVGVFGPGHLGELTQILDFALVDAVLEETGAVQQRIRLVPSRVVVYFVLALALYEKCGYRAVWGKLTCALVVQVARPAASSLARARRRVGPAPFRALFDAVAGPVGSKDTPGVLWRGLRTVALDGTCLRLPDLPAVTWRFPERSGEHNEFGYPLLRLLVLVETGTRALIAASFGPEGDGELVYAGRLLDRLAAGMLLLADAGFDAVDFFRAVAKAETQFLIRGPARRLPPVSRRLPDGSYLSRLGYGHPGGMFTVRIVEAWVTVTDANGVVRTEAWRLITSLLDCDAYPAADLVALYHERWQVETTYFSVKSTMLDGRVLRSRTVDGIEQELWALLAAYQGIVSLTADAVASVPGTDPDRVKFTVALQTAADQVAAAAGIIWNDGDGLVGAIGKAVLADLNPERRRPSRAKARSRKSTSKYQPNQGKYPQTAVYYTIEVAVEIMKEGLTTRSTA